MKSGYSQVCEQRMVSAGGWMLLVVLLLGTVGCDTDSFIDPSVVGRWEHTPVTLPILDRLDVIEEPAEAIPGLSQITSEDLIPQVTEYVMGPGDLITVTVFELITPNVESVQTRRIDELGYMRLPVIGQIRTSGLTTKQLEQKMINVLHPNILRNPTVSVIVQEARQKTFNVIGAAGSPGTYTLLKDNFRLLDALSLARGIPTQTQKLYVIRQVPLSRIVETGRFAPNEAPGESTPPQGPQMPGNNQPATQPGDPTDKGDLLEDLSKQLDDAPAPGSNPAAPAHTDVPDTRRGHFSDPATADTAGLGQALEQPAAANGRWVNVNGKWVRVENAPAPAPTAAGAEAKTSGGSGGGDLPSPDQLVTQRVIEVDAKELMKGLARYNIVVRPDDIVRVPEPVTGNVYVGGQIARPGTYALPGDRELTLKQLVMAAGGLGPLAIPERVDLIRRIGPDSEATVRLNLRAIFDGVQPDIYLKPNDTINIGTNIGASFLAVLRNSFRASYGFGFLLDRNFSEQVFGVLRGSGG